MKLMGIGGLRFFADVKPTQAWAASVVLLSFLAAIGCVRATPLFDTDRVNLDAFLLGERQIGNRCCDHSVNPLPSDRYQDEPVSSDSSQVLRFELRYDDPDAPFSSKRAEITLDGTVKGIGVIGGLSEWYGFSVFLPSDYPPDPAAELIAQWHATPDEGEIFRSPVLGLLNRNGHWQIVGRSSMKQIQLANDAPEQLLWKGPYRTGIWTSFIFQTRWDWRVDGHGMVRAWSKLATTESWQPILTYHGPIGYRDDRDIYFKAGIYKWPWEDCQRGDLVELCSGSGSPQPSQVERRVIYLKDLHVLGGSDATFSDFLAMTRP